MTKAEATNIRNTAAVAAQGATVAPGKDSSKNVASPTKGAPKGQKAAKGKTRAAPPSPSTAGALARSRVHPKIALRNTTLVVDLPGTSSRFRVGTAQVTLLASGRRPIHWRFAASKGSVTIELPRKEAWDLIEEVHKQSIAPVRARRKKKGTAR